MFFFDTFAKSFLFYGIEIDELICDNYPGLNRVHQKNRIQVQHLSFDMCGLFCAFFLYYSCLDLSMTEIVIKFEHPKNLLVSDKISRTVADSRLCLCTDPN